jgi:hypothetical protein
VAVFACADVGLLEVVGLPEAPETSPERAVLGIRPHVRPLLAALQSSSPRLAAVNVGAAETLAVPFDGLIPGYECGRCGALGLAADCCPDWGTAALPVPDLIEEMVSRTLEDGGQVLVVQDAPGGIVVRMPSSPSG